MKCKINKSKLTTMVAVSLGVLPHVAHAQAPIVISSTQDLHFGTVATTNNMGGTVTVRPDGTRLVTGVVAVTGAGLERQGIINIAGSSSLAIDVTITNTQFNVSDAGNMMVVNNFDIVATGNGRTASVSITAGSVQVDVGARLNISAMQADGTYTGTYGIRANYQ